MYKLKYPRYVVACLTCGKDFLQKRGWQKFCSDNCRNTFWNNRPDTICCPNCKYEIKLHKVFKEIQNESKR
jgi:rubredoxin